MSEDVLKDAFIQQAVEDLTNSPTPTVEENVELPEDGMKDSFISEAIGDLNPTAAKKKIVEKQPESNKQSKPINIDRVAMLNEFAATHFGKSPIDVPVKEDLPVSHTVDSVKMEAQEESEVILKKLLKGIK